MDLSGLLLTLTLEEIRAVSMSLPVKLYVISLRLKGGKHKVKGKKNTSINNKTRTAGRMEIQTGLKRMKQDDGFASRERESNDSPCCCSWVRGGLPMPV